MRGLSAARREPHGDSEKGEPDMGCYDTIIFTCPNCGNDIAAQSKGGECLLETYSANAVPADVAGNANRHPIICRKCNTRYVADIPTVSLQLTRVVDESME